MNHPLISLAMTIGGCVGWLVAEQFAFGLALGLAAVALGAALSFLAA